MGKKTHKNNLAPTHRQCFSLMQIFPTVGTTKKFQCQFYKGFCFLKKLHKNHHILKGKKKLEIAIFRQ
jgi:hypothetical protein